MTSLGAADSQPVIETLRLRALDNIVALAGGGQSTVLTPAMLTAAFYRVTTVANPNDSLTLTPSRQGDLKVVINAAAANSLNVFPQKGEAINALSANTAFAVAAGKTALFICTAVGQWHSILSP